MLEINDTITEMNVPPGTSFISFIRIKDNKIVANKNTARYGNLIDPIGNYEKKSLVPISVKNPKFPTFDSTVNLPALFLLSVATILKA